MNNKTTALTLLSLALLLAYIPMAFAHNAPFPGGYDPTHFVIDTIGDPETMDPAWAYDTASGEVIQQVYSTLIYYDVNWEEGPTASVGPGKKGAGLTDVFIPQLATVVPTSLESGGNGLIDYTSSEINPKTGAPYFSTWYFPIRSGVQFHAGWGALTPADVEYSMEREMIQDRDGGPQWMLFEPLLEKYYASVVSGPASADGEEINNAVKSNSTHVWFNLVAAYPELAFKQILAQSWGSVVSKAWAISRGDFDGNWAAPWEDIFNTWHNPEVSPLDSPSADMVGTGPYMFSYWRSGIDYSIIRNPSYFGGWPAPSLSKVGGTGDVTTLGGYVETVTWRELASWTVRRGNFLSGTSDETVVPRSYRDQVLGQIVGGEKIRNEFPVAPVLSCNGLFFTFDIATTSLYMGIPLPPGTFNTNGIPPDIFSDINARRGFAYAFNYNNYLTLAFLNEGTQPADPIVPGLAYDNVPQQMYSYNLAKAEYFLRLAWGGVADGSGIEDPSHIVTSGALWNGGMKFQTVYNIGNVPRELASAEIANEVNALNPTRFFIEPLGLDWGTQVLPAMVASQLPLFHIGWLADYADPHDFVFPFQHSLGTFSQYQRYGNPVVDALIQAGIATSDELPGTYDGSLDAPDAIPLMDNVGVGKTYDPDWRNWPTNTEAYLTSEGGTPLDNNYPRRAIYYALQEIWYEDLPTILYLQGIGRHFELPWTRGWYYNSLYPGGYYYHRWKALTHFGDVSSPGAYGMQDDAVGPADAAFVSAHWSSPVSVYGYHTIADINGGVGATTGALTGPVRGMQDGKVDILDLGLVSAYWDPTGPSHP